MSKKSRRRNKALLALAGIAGAAALSNRKAKKELGDTETTSRMEVSLLNLQNLLLHR